MNELLVNAALKVRALLRDERGDGVVTYVLVLAFIAAVAAATLPGIKYTITTMTTEANSALSAVGK